MNGNQIIHRRGWVRGWAGPICDDRADGATTPDDAKVTCLRCQGMIAQHATQQARKSA